MARLRQLFPEAAFVSTDAFGSVGLGLALDARRKFGADPGTGPGLSADWLSAGNDPAGGRVA